MYAAEGRFTFTSHTAGEHQICLHSNSTAWFGGGKLVSLCVYNESCDLMSCNLVIIKALAWTSEI